MQAIIYVQQNDDISLYIQFNRCAEYSKRKGYSISGKVLDYDGKNFYKAVNKVIANENITVLMIYSKELAFNQYDDYLFYRIYLENLGKKLVCVN